VDPETKAFADVLLGLCDKCKKVIAAEPHACPFNVEVHDDRDTLCTCCGSCTHDCLREV
jgi:hypothetical protein